MQEQNNTEEEEMSENKLMAWGLFLWCHVSAVFLAVAIAAVFGFPVYAGNAKQLEFESPRKAFDALVNAAGSNDTEELLAILGSEGKDVISSGDAVADTRARERFVRATSEGVGFKKLDEKTFLAVIGKDAWSFPIPIIRSGKSWIFFTEEGKQEIINRRIGRNELNTIQTSRTYVEAQREYAKKALGDNGVLQYAQHFASREGGRDGLYWPGRADSPLGPLFAHAACEVDASSGQAVGKPSPYYGYYFNILKSQGSHAPGGAMDYVIDGRMTAGFGLVAYPAKYGVSGIMTFIVNQQGVLFEKDLGPKTDEIAKAMTVYDPDQTWKKVE
jgi:hypothetical protein